MATKYTKWPKNRPTCSIARPSEIYPNWDFWFENMPKSAKESAKKKFPAFS
jgi:hypothetical protein